MLLEAIERSRPRLATPYYNRFSEVFRNVVHEALRTASRCRPTSLTGCGRR